MSEYALPGKFLGCFFMNSCSVDCHVVEFKESFVFKICNDLSCISHCFRKTDGMYYFKITPLKKKKKKVLLSLRRRPPLKDTVFSQRTFITTLIKQESTFSRFSWFSCQSQWSVCGAVQGFISCPSCSGPFNHHTKRQHRLLRKRAPDLEPDLQV